MDLGTLQHKTLLRDVAVFSKALTHELSEMDMILGA